MTNAAARLLSAHDGVRIALQCGDEKVSYASLRERVARAAAVWRARGVQPGQPVAVMLADGIDWVVAWLGALWAGAVGVGVNPRIPADEWLATLAEAGFAQILAEDEGATPAPWQARVLPLSLARLLWRNAAPTAAVPREDDDAAFWVHSSGTSGRPKAVVHAQHDLDVVAATSVERLGMTANDRLFASSRLFFTYPLANSLLAGLSVGATVLLDPQWPTPRGLVSGLRRMRPSVLFTVPAMLRSLLHEELASHFDPAEGSSLRLVASAGEALPAPLRERWQRATRLPLVDGYGTSETLVLVMTSRADSAPGVATGEAQSAEGALHPSPGVHIEVLDAAAAARGDPTRLAISCPTLALGYHGRDNSEFAGRRFAPADRFIALEGGGWRFAGREDSLVKISGRWVDLVSLEERLASGMPGLREAALACIDGAEGLPELALFFVADDPVIAGQLLQQRIGMLPHHQRPASLHALSLLPRTPTGKLLRRRLREWLAPPASAA